MQLPDAKSGRRAAVPGSTVKQDQRVTAPPIAAFTAIKISAGLDLVWLGVQAIRHGSASTLKKAAGRRKAASQVFLMGLGINLLNPKIVMFF